MASNELCNIVLNIKCRIASIQENISNKASGMFLQISFRFIPSNCGMFDCLVINYIF